MYHLMRRTVGRTHLSICGGGLTRSGVEDLKKARWYLDRLIERLRVMKTEKFSVTFVLSVDKSNNILSSHPMYYEEDIKGLDRACYL